MKLCILANKGFFLYQRQDMNKGSLPLTYAIEQTTNNTGYM